MDRSRLITSALIVVIVVLGGWVFSQNNRITQLQNSMEFQQKQFEEQSGKLAAEKLRNHRGEVVQAAQWLHDYYKSDAGLKRPNGLWREDQKQPDFEAIGAWIYDTYLNARVEGKSEEEARKLVTDAIQGSDEWRRVHAAPAKK